MRCVLGYDWQLDKLVTFCTDPDEMSVLGADPTLNLGQIQCHSIIVLQSQGSGESKWPPFSNDWTDPDMPNKDVR